MPENLDITAEKRKLPYIWASWLGKSMSGDLTCLYQTWFQTHYKLTETAESDFDLTEWKMNHTRMLNQLIDGFSDAGLQIVTEHPFQQRFPQYNKATIGGRMDLVVINPPDIIVIDAKTGKPRGSDVVQVQLYMNYVMQDKEWSKYRVRGIVNYKGSQHKIPSLPNSFQENFEYFMAKLTGEKPPKKVPGRDCKFCPLTKADCPEKFTEEKVEKDDDDWS